MFLDYFNSFCHLLGRWSFVNRLGVLEQILISRNFDCVKYMEKLLPLDNFYFDSFDFTLQSSGVGSIL